MDTIKYIQSDQLYTIDASYLEGKTKNDFLDLSDSQTLSSQERDNILRKLDIADERLNLTIECTDPSAILGVVVTVSYDGTSTNYNWTGDTLSIIIPMFSQYTVSFSSISDYYTPDTFSFIAKKNFVRNINVSYDAVEKYIDLSMRNINGITLQSRETANCYVIKSTGYYELPLVYGNAIKNGETNSSSYTQVEGDYTQPFYNYLNRQITSPFIETDTNVDANSADIIYSDVSISSFNISNVELVQKDLCKYLRFQVNTFPKNGGNAVLGVKDGSGQIMWSWHIWAYGDTLTTVAHTNDTGYTYNLLNVNLGWVKEGEKYGTSPYYQWGRKDPMLRSSGSTSDNTNATVGYGSWTYTSVASSVAATIQNPNVFNMQEDTNHNWWVKEGNTVNFYNYWDASQTSTGNADKTVVKTVYDPCPAGFSIPCGNTFTGFSKSNGGKWDSGLIWDGRYFPAPGFRYMDSGILVYVSNGGFYWLSSSYSQSSSYYLNFNSSLNVDSQCYGERVFGFSVCPVAQPELI